MKQEGKICQKTLQLDHIDTVSHSLGDLIPCLCCLMFNDVINAIAVCLKTSLCNDLTVKMNRKWRSMTSYLSGIYIHACSAAPGSCDRTLGIRQELLSACPMPSSARYMHAGYVTEHLACACTGHILHTYLYVIQPSIV